MPLWSLWQGKPAKLRGMVMKQEWSMRSKETEPSIVVHTRKDGIEKESVTNKIVTDIEKMKNSSVVSNSPQNFCFYSHDNKSQIIDERKAPGSVVYDRKGRTIKIRCRDGWVPFQQVILTGHKPMTAQDFNNGFISKVPKSSHRFT